MLHVHVQCRLPQVFVFLFLITHFQFVTVFYMYTVYMQKKYVHVYSRCVRSLKFVPHASSNSAVWISLCYCAFQQHADSEIQSLTDKCVFRYHQSNIWRLFSASDYCRACSNQIKSLSTVQTTYMSSEAGRSCRIFD